MLSNGEIRVWKRLEAIESRIDRVIEDQRQLSNRIEALARKERRHYG